MKHKFLKFISVFLLLMSSLTAIASTFSKGQVVWLKPNSDWKGASAWFAINFEGGSNWMSMTKWSDEYYFAVLSYDASYLIFCRMNPSGDGFSWDRKWNQTNNLSPDGTNNCVEITGWDKSSKWSTYTPNLRLPGSWGWGTTGTDNIMSVGNGGIATITKTLSQQSYIFKVYKEGGWLGNNGTMSRSSHSSWTFSTSVSSDATITADVAGDYIFKWDISTDKLTAYYPAKFSLDAQSGTQTGTNPLIVTYGTLLPASITKPSRTGYTFGGYYSGQGGSGTQYYDADGIRVYNNNANEEDITLYAKWTAKTYTVTLNPQGGTGGSTSVTATYDAAMPSATMPTKTGYTFNGYFDAETGGTQYYKADGTSAKNWDKTANTTLYAQWTVKSYDITYSPSLAPEHCTYSNMAATGTYGQSASFTITPEVNYEVTITVKDANDAVVSYTKNGNTYTITSMPASNVTVTVTCNYVSQKFDVTFGVCTASQELGSVTVNGETTSPTQVTENTTATIIATGATGYEWNSWYFDAAGSNKIVDATSATYTPTITGPMSVYASFKAKQFTVSFNTQGGSECDPISVTYHSTYGTLPTSTKSDYDFVGWFTEATGGTEVTSNTEVTITDNQTLFAHWSETLHTITIVGGTAASTTAGVATEGTATVRALADDEKFTGWNIPSGITLTQGSVNSNTIKFHANADDLTVTANIAKKTLVKLYFANNDGWEAVAAYAYGNGDGNNNKWPGEVITSNTEVINCVTYYYFQYYTEAHDWTQVIFNNNNNGKQAADLTIADRASDYADKENWLAAPYDALWAFYIQKSNKADGADHIVDCESGQATASLLANTHYIFKAHNKVTGKWYGNNNGEEANYIKGSVTNWDFWDDANDCNMRTNDAGTYTFAISQIVSSSQIKVSVTYPAAQTYTVTMANDGHGTTTPSESVELNEFTGTQISATPATGYHFDKWVGTTGITFTDANAATTTAKASQTGTITATFAKNTPIYFKNAIKTNWNPEHVYIYLYKDNTYWDGTYGTGANKSKYEGSCIAGPIEMTHIQNTDIWEYDYDPALSFNTIVFAEQLMDGYEWFANCTAVRRADYNSCMNMFVLNNATEEWHNETARYFNKGFWKSYDAESAKLYIHMEKEPELEFNTKEGPNEYSVTHKLTPSGSGTEYYDYYFYIGACNGKNYSVEGGTITPEHPTITLYEFELNPKDQNKQVTLKANVQGDYKFTVIHNDDNTLTLTVDYPYGVNDYRVVSVYNEQVHENGFVYKKENGATNIASFYVNNGYKVKVQRVSQIVGEIVTWADVSPEVSVSISELEKGGVYNFEFAQSESGDLSLTNKGAYTGTYYIRTDGVAGGWSGYMQNKDNEMYNYGSMLDAGSTYDNFQFDFYKAKWILKNVNVKFCIANDYSKDLSGYFESDDIIDNTETSDVHEQSLPQDANVRFMWNSENNTLKRAYISGSTNLSDRFLVLEGDEKMFDKDGQALKIDGLHANEINFDDKNNWVYQADIKAQANCAVKLTAAYNGTVQYFIGAAGEGEGARRTIITSSKIDDPTQYAMHAVYDFKTNRLVAGWMPDGTPITTEIKLGGDMLLVRDHQEDVKQITFGSSEGKVTDIKHVYSVLSIKKDVMLGQTDDYTTAATNSDYERTMYWISFPFEVKISEVFGVDGYGTKWIMQRYNGEKRAANGWFKGDGVETFWEYLAPTATLKPYKGYLLILNANFFNTDKADVWGNSATEANFYFPSTSGEIGIVQADNFEQVVPEHACGIDRTFDADDTHTGLNHKITDSHWNVIGVPAFQNSTASSLTGTDLKSFYQWIPASNSYEAATTLGGTFEFQTMYAYMVQFGGTINWTNVSVISKAPYAYADDKNYMIELFFNGNGAEDHTYVKLADGAHTDFELNEDMMKIDNAGYPNIYSFAGNYNVAYNETKMIDQVVTIGVSAPKDGSYTFSMPKDFSGSAILVDLEEGTFTDLNVSNYSVDLNKGTYNNRFQLMLEVEAKIPTNMRNVDSGEWSVDGKTKKLLINDQIYLINGGRVYNATGVQLR